MKGMKINFDQVSDENLVNLIGRVIDYLTDIKNEAYTVRYSRQVAERISVNPPMLSRARSHDWNTLNRDKRIEILLKIIDAFDIEINKDLEIIPVFNYKPLEELSARLAINLVDSSTNFDPDLKPHREILTSNLCGQIMHRNKRRLRERYIMVIGAGASYAVTKKAMPLAKEAAQQIKEMVAPEGSELKKLIENEIKRLKQIYKIHHEDFETILMACSKYNRERVFKELQNICGIKYMHSLTYDIIAHMLKHRLIDVVVNFNFDEILDEAILEEIGSGDFHYIYSDGDCPDQLEKEFFINKRLKKPIYIKPHGTISHLSSLRFTREDYLAVPTKIQETVDFLVSGTLDTDSAQNMLPINFIILGFGMQSPEFIQIIRNYLETHQEQDVLPRFWIFDIKNNIKDFNLPIDITSKIKDRVNFIKIDADLNNIDEVFKDFWNKIISNFDETITPKNITRHEFLHAIFRHDSRRTISKRLSHESCKEYFRQRFYAELLLTFLQSDGIMHLKQINEGRVGKYFRLFKTVNPDISIHQGCSNLGLRQYKDYLSEAYTYVQANQFYSRETDNNLLEKLQKCFSPPTDQFNYRYNMRAELLGFMQQIRTGKRLKIAPKFQDPHEGRFRKVDQNHVLHTGIRWIYTFKQYLTEKNTEWDLMLSVTEHGRFIQKYQNTNSNLFKNKKIELILASIDIKDFPNKINFQNSNLTLLSQELVYLPWKLHNQHMVLFLKRENSNTGNWEQDWTLKQGFYFRSYMLARHVNPISFAYEEDLKILLKIFAEYWFKGKAYTKSINNNKELPHIIPMIKDGNHIYKVITELLGLYDQELPKKK